MFSLLFVPHLKNRHCYKNEVFRSAMNLNVERLFHFGSQKIDFFIHTPVLAATFWVFFFWNQSKEAGVESHGGVLCHEKMSSICHNWRSWFQVDLFSYERPRELKELIESLGGGSRPGVVVLPFFCRTDLPSREWIHLPPNGKKKSISK